jgi:hypothetical protein
MNNHDSEIAALTDASGRIQCLPPVLEPEVLVDSCLDLLGPVEVGADTKKELVEQAKEWGQIRWDTAANAQAATKHTGELLQLIVATREYQFA